MIRKSVLFNADCIEKAHKYIRRYMDSEGKWQYIYPSNQPRNVSRRKAIKTIAKETPIILGNILTDLSEENIDKELEKLKQLSQNQELKCKAIGNYNIGITENTKNHAYETKGVDRSAEETIHKLKYLPFVPEILSKGKLLYKSYRHEFEEDKETGVKGKEIKHKHLTYGVVCRIKYFDPEKKKNVVEPLELVIAYNEDKKKYVLSFIDYDINVS